MLLDLEIENMDMSVWVFRFTQTRVEVLLLGQVLVRIMDPFQRIRQRVLDLPGDFKRNNVYK